MHTNKFAFPSSIAALAALVGLFFFGCGGNDGASDANTAGAAQTLGGGASYAGTGNQVPPSAGSTTTSESGGPSTGAGGNPGAGTGNIPPTAGSGGAIAAGGSSSGAAGGTSNAGSGGTGSGSAGSGSAGAPASGGSWNTTGVTCSPQTWDASPIGWATQGGGTTGGGTVAATMVSSLSEFNTAARGSNAAVIHVSGKISGTVTVGSNKTILGLCGAQLTGSLDLTGSANVIVRNLKVVGLNCTDSPSDCSAGADAVHVQTSDRRLWFDHMDISDGSDGNLDITHGADFITISWTKFHYSTKRSDPAAGSNGHRFCNLVGHDDSNASEDTGHLNVTFHHVWWADNVNQRMPRVRFGKVHVFNSLYTASGDSACIEVGVNANIRSENNVFQGVTNTVDSSHANSASIIQSIGNQGSSTNLGGKAFTPPYTYTAEAVTAVASSVMTGAGPK